MKYTCIAALAIIVMAGCTETGNPTGATVYTKGQTVEFSLVVQDSQDPYIFSVWTNGHLMDTLYVYGTCSPSFTMTEDADSLNYAFGGWFTPDPHYSGVNTDCIVDTIAGSVSCWGTFDDGDTILIP